MIEDLAKGAIKKTMMKLFSLEFEDLDTKENYIELLYLCKNIDKLESYKWLIFRALEIIFIENNTFKDKIENQKAIKYFDYLIDKKAYAKDKEFQNGFIEFKKKYYEVFQKSGFPSKEKEVLEFIGEVTKDVKIILECIDFISANAIQKYVKSQCKYKFFGKLEDYLDQLKTFFEKGEPDSEKEYFSIEYDDEKKFHFKYFSYKEVEPFYKKADKPPTLKDIKKYISLNSITVLKSKKKEGVKGIEIKSGNPNEERSNLSFIINNEDNQKNIKENKNEEETGFDIKEKKLLDFIKKEYDEKFKLQDIRINSLQKENAEQSTKINSLQKENAEHSTKINSLQKENEQIKLNNISLNKKIKSMEKYQRDDINRLEKIMDEEKNKLKEQLKREKINYLELKEKISNYQSSNKKSEKDKEKQSKEISDLEKDKYELNNKLNKIKCRTLIKSIIDFFYYVYTSNVQGDNYFTEKNSIIQEIEKKDKTNLNETQKLILSQLVEYLNAIYNLKIEGDDFAHPLAEFDLLISLVGHGYENIINLLNQLELTLLFKKYNELYKLRIKDGNTDKIMEEIELVLSEKKDNFLQLFRNLL